MANNDSVYDAIKGLLGDNAEEKIGAVMNTLSNGNHSENNAEVMQKQTPEFNLKNIDYLMRLRNVMDELENVGDDNRSRLLISLKPYMSTSRKKTIDSAIKLLNLTKLSSLFSAE